MVRVNFPRGRCIQQISTRVLDVIRDALSQVVRVMQGAVWKTPELWHPIPKQFCCSERLICTLTCCAKTGTVSQDDHVYVYSGAHMGCYRATAAKYFVIRVRRQHQGSRSIQAGYCCIGDKVEFQWGLHKTGLTLIEAQDSEI